MTTGHVNDYDGFAQEYATGNEVSSYNAYYERPAMLGLVGDVSGLRVLDAGCGAGVFAAELAGRGAEVTGIDMSENLLAIARSRAPGEFRRHDLTEPLPFADASFDLAVASLVMHYIEDWVPPLRELHRVLAPGGRFAFSTHHVFMVKELTDNDDYFAVHQYEDQWVRGGRVMHMRFWHRPLRAMFADFAEAGFTVSRFIEPDPDPALADRDPEDFAVLAKQPQCMLFELVRGS
ncbi:class I SAM-dependent methyltransferase [Labedaea rhizosphaerae]|uniref:Methyltransferase family protein n=1 Tax=Labedaea rhizosphaerae TaxID=598644 RepID=A0A4R6SPA0_LABRH|nr:class I SAM-dependent methyltransferase [Labedaea rhizosphaerae]TDQ05824.1 methyltransferase family protein [Labedaea rhizosphaerae]